MRNFFFFGFLKMGFVRFISKQLSKIVKRDISNWTDEKKKRIEKTKPKYKPNEFRFDMYKHSTNVKLQTQNSNFLYCVKNAQQTVFTQKTWENIQIVYVVPSFLEIVLVKDPQINVNFAATISTFPLFSFVTFEWSEGKNLFDLKSRVIRV